MKHVVSFSGGKDSTAMLLMMIEKKMPINEIIFCDTGLEFPEIYAHIAKIEKHINKKIIFLKAPHSFEYYATKQKRTCKDGSIRIGKGWPSAIIRWCTGVLKRDVCSRYLKHTQRILYVGIAYDEYRRMLKKKQIKNTEYPLITWKITGEDALEYCYSKGFDWDGLYKHTERMGCYLCPLQRLGNLEYLYNNYPELWDNMVRIDKLCDNDFRPGCTLSQLTKRFSFNKRQLTLF